MKGRIQPPEDKIVEHILAEIDANTFPEEERAHFSPPESLGPIAAEIALEIIDCAYRIENPGLSPLFFAQQRSHATCSRRVDELGQKLQTQQREHDFAKDALLVNAYRGMMRQVFDTVKNEIKDTKSDSLTRLNKAIAYAFQGGRLETTMLLLLYKITIPCNKETVKREYKTNILYAKYKEPLFELMKMLPVEIQMKIFKWALDRNTQIGSVFWTQRGLFECARGRGMLAKIEDALNALSKNTRTMGP